MNAFLKVDEDCCAIIRAKNYIPGMDFPMQALRARIFIEARLELLCHIDEPVPVLGRPRSLLGKNSELVALEGGDNEIACLR
jgi:hypothetical protein